MSAQAAVGRKPTKATEGKIDDTDTRTRLIRAASHLFSAKGIDAVSTRDITTSAQANSAAIGYHFGSKENLVREVFNSLVGPLNRTRLEALTEYEASVGLEAPLDVELVARCLIEPALISASDPHHDGHALSKLLPLVRSQLRPWISTLLAEQYDEIFHRFIAAFQRAIPELDYQTLCWRYDFLSGTVVYASGYYQGPSRIARITGGDCDPSNVEAVIEQLVQFAGGAMLHGLHPPRHRK